LEDKSLLMLLNDGKHPARYIAERAQKKKVFGPPVAKPAEASNGNIPVPPVQAEESKAPQKVDKAGDRKKKQKKKQ